VYTSENLAAIREAVVPPFLALFLYGSYARGDEGQLSDIDILQLVPTHTAPYSRGKINVTCYTPDQLTRLAKNGSLFVRHLISEAIALEDPTNFLKTLRSTYVAPGDYKHVCADVTSALPLVAIPEAAYRNNWCHYAATGAYLLRTYVYAKAFSLGATSFSMQHITDVIGDWRPRQRLVDLRLHQDYDRFRDVVAFLFEVTNTPPFCRYESLEAFVVNSYGSCELAVILGLRILARGSLLTYAWDQSIE
jgi:hypothetical protein